MSVAAEITAFMFLVPSKLSVEFEPDTEILSMTPRGTAKLSGDKK